MDHSIVFFLVLISVFGGALHMLAPDHWVPASIFGWKRGWSLTRLAAFSMMVFVPHVLMGFLIYLFFERFFSNLPTLSVFIFSLFLVGVAAALRGIRFKRIREVLRGGESQGIWGTWTVLSLLGPCESMIPILFKAKLLGTGYLLPISAFLVGTLLSGVVLVACGRFLWNHPHWRPRGIQWSSNGILVLPVLAGVVLSFAFLFRIS